MFVDVGTFNDGGVALVSDRPMPDIVKRVEFYREQRLMMLVYANEENGDELMHYEVPDNMIYAIEKSPDVTLFMMFSEEPPLCYKVPLIKVGNLH